MTNTNPFMGRADLLFRQASMTAHDYFHAAIHDIDEKFGDGYAKSHPELVGAFMRTCAADFAATWTHDVLEEIESALGRVAEALGELGYSTRDGTMGAAQANGGQGDA
jgi:hypothetical protein